MFDFGLVMASYQAALLEAENRKRSHQRAMEAGPEALAAWDRAEEKRKQDLLVERDFRIRERQAAALEELARQGRSPLRGAFGGALAGSIVGNLLFD